MCTLYAMRGLISVGTAQPDSSWVCRRSLFSFSINRNCRSEHHSKAIIVPIGLCAEPRQPHRALHLLLNTNCYSNCNILKMEMENHDPAAILHVIFSPQLLLFFHFGIRLSAEADFPNSTNVTSLNINAISSY